MDENNLQDTLYRAAYVAIGRYPGTITVGYNSETVSVKGSWFAGYLRVAKETWRSAIAYAIGHPHLPAPKRQQRA